MNTGPEKLSHRGKPGAPVAESFSEPTPNERLADRQQRITAAGNNTQVEATEIQCDTSPYPSNPEAPNGKKNAVAELTNKQNELGTSPTGK